MTPLPQTSPWPPLMRADGSAPELDEVPILRASDYPKGQLAAAASRGKLIRLTRGLFTPVPDRGRAWQQRLAIQRARIRAAAMSMPKDSAIGYWHAALLHGIPVLELPEKVSIISTGNGSGRSVLGYKRHYRKLLDDEFEYVNGIRVTTFRRTVIDVIGLPDPVAALAAFDHALRAETGANRFNPERALRFAEFVRAEYERLLEHGAPDGIRRARAIIRAGNPLAETIAESMARRAVLIIGLPEPTLQVPVRIGPDRVVYTDLGWEVTVDGETFWIHIEIDGALKYEGPDVTAATFLEEKARHQEIQLLGHTVLRFSWADLCEPGLRKIRAAVFATFPAEVLKRLKPRRELMTDAEREYW